MSPVTITPYRSNSVPGRCSHWVVVLKNQVPGISFGTTYVRAPVTVDYRTAANPYEARYGADWEEQIKNSITMRHCVYH